MAAGELAQKAADAGQRRAVLDQETYAEQAGKSAVSRRGEALQARLADKGVRNFIGARMDG